MCIANVWILQNYFVNLSVPCRETYLATKNSNLSNQNLNLSDFFLKYCVGEVCIRKSVCALLLCDCLLIKRSIYNSTLGIIEWQCKSFSYGPSAQWCAYVIHMIYIINPVVFEQTCDFNVNVCVFKMRSSPFISICLW